MRCRFFIVSVGSFWKYARPEHSKASFQMTFFSFVFPNTALITATFQIGKAFQCTPIEIVGCALTGLLVLVWAAIFGLSPCSEYIERAFLSPRSNEYLRAIRDNDKVHLEEATFMAKGGVRTEHTLWSLQHWYVDVYGLYAAFPCSTNIEVGKMKG